MTVRFWYVDFGMAMGRLILKIHDKGQFSYLVMSRFSLIALLALIILGILVPVYTDEIGWRFMERAGFDGFDSMPSDICGPNTRAVPPFFMWPVRYFSFAVTWLFPDPLFIRAFGVLNAILWIGLFSKWMAVTVANKAELRLLKSLSYGFMALGLFPLLFVWSRPEQPLNLALILSLILYSQVLNWPRPERAGRVLQALVAAIGLYIIALSYHPKAILISPIFFVLFHALVMRIERRFVRTASVGLIAVVFGVSYAYWSRRFACPGDPVLASDLAYQNLVAAYNASLDLAKTITLFIIGNPFIKYFDHLAFAPPENTMSTWIYADQLPGTIAVLSRVIVIVLWVSLIYFAFVHLLVALMRRATQVVRSGPMIIAILISLFVISTTQVVKNAYEATLIVPLVLCLVVYISQIYRLSSRVKPHLVTANRIMTVLIILNGAVLLTYYSGSLIATASDRGDIHKQPYSQSVFHYDDIRQKINAVAGQCGIKNDVSSRHVLVDDVTYLALARTYNPFHFYSVVELWNGSIDDPLAYLKSKGSSGLVLTCRRIPALMKDQVQGDGEICCMGLQ